MALPDDLKHHSEDSFQLFTEGETLTLLGVVLAACLLLDLLQRVAS